MSNDQLTKEELHELDVDSDSQLGKMEKETTLNFPNDLDRGTIYTDVPTTVRWVLSVEESEIQDYRLQDGDVVSVTASISKGIIKLQGNSRKSNGHGGMVSYGPHKDQVV